MMAKWFILGIVLGVGSAYSVVAGKLTWLAACCGVLLALLIYGTGGFTGIAMMAFFFLAGTVATSWKLQWKQQQGLAESNKGKRTAGQVIANAGIPALAGLIGMLIPSVEDLMRLMIAAAFAAATADTLSSELGNIYGRRYYNILSFKKDQRGLDGVVSLEGTACGLAGSFLIAIIYAIGSYGSSGNVLIIILAGTLGNITDSVLGATVERKQWIGNDAVNFLNTAIAALSAWAMTSA
jgi:uncharacterized protein (TIGR00297 family)